ncbi:cytochrome oxidase subunit III [Lichenicola cladoniae]|uniref:Cytochrome oxidase subunit III n=1 Tax=Lichenicola cladoniae TaxID=1484109 RepID=A0A6M8HUD2_9PROT|nr:cytochrome c oxidase subunit 3 [Lichenicola cladoniae]NPD69494.1 cytochrome oxidase subunit III [Acetobacteraceae bacterium]QKE92139.1 cytochrome oxidase subunit III [Lichenicola cladoniae]
MSGTVAHLNTGPTAEVGLEREEHFTTDGQQIHAAKFGLWCWLLTELLLFAGLFLTALVLRIMHPQAVTEVAKHLKFWIGATNTAVLIVSSFTMSGAIELSRLGWQRGMVRCMLATAALGSLFLVLKGYEYYEDWDEHMMPFLSSRPYVLTQDPSSRLFTDLYYITTGLHGLHLLTGVSILLVMTWMASRPGFLGRRQNRIEIFGLYWHFIDLIWIIVFPVLYVLNR